MGQCIAAFFGNATHEDIPHMPGESVEDTQRRYWRQVATGARIAADAMIEARK